MKKKSSQLAWVMMAVFVAGPSCGTKSDSVSSDQSSGSASTAEGRGACQGINLPGNYTIVQNCPFGPEEDWLAPGSKIQLTVKAANDGKCTFAADSSVTLEKREYSITPPPGVLRGPYDMCALWAFDEGSRPGSFPPEMREPCRIWTHRPPDRLVKTVKPLHQELSESQVRLDIARRVSDIGSCSVRR